MRSTHVKFWHVKLYRQTEKRDIITGIMFADEPLHEGFSRDEITLPPRDGAIKLFTNPNDNLVKIVRADIVDFIVCTPVFEEEEEKAAPDPAEERYNRDSFSAAAEPLIQWLNENANPHALVAVNCTSAELFTGEISARTNVFVKD